MLFNELDVDAYFLEYDDERSGDFAPLRYVPDGQDRRARPGHEQAARARAVRRAGPRGSTRRPRYVPMDQLCLSPQCGFASTVEGNALTEDEQWAKLRHVVETAARIWG